MKNKKIVTLAENCVLQEFNIDMFDKNIQIELNKNTTALISNSNLKRRLNALDKDKIIKENRRELIGNPLEVIIYIKSVIRNILWGLGGITKEEKTFGLNGYYDLEIDDAIMFKNAFGSNVSESLLRTKLLEITTYIIKDCFEKYLKDRNGIDELNLGKEKLEDMILLALEHSISLADVGVKITNVKVESFIKN